jgi:integrase
MNGSFGSGLGEKYQAEAVLDQWYDPETEVLVCNPHKNALLKHGKKGTVNSLVRLQGGMAKRRSGRGIPDRRIYDLRASFASRANACRASGLTIAQLLGHANNTQILPTYVKALDKTPKL